MLSLYCINYDAITDEEITGTIEIMKVNADNEPLKGAEFSLYDSKGSLVEKVSSDKNGEAVFSDVPYGNYSIKETAAPAMYELSSKVINVSIQTDATVKKYTYVNKLRKEYAGGDNSYDNTLSASGTTAGSTENVQTASASSADGISSVNKTLPATGDNYIAVPWLTGILLLSGGTMAVLLGKRKKQRND